MTDSSDAQDERERHAWDSFLIADQAHASCCDPRCSSAHHRHLRRGRTRPAYVADVSKSAVFKRDGWPCQPCHRPIPPHLRDPNIGRRFPDGNMPSRPPVLDHVIPLAAGAGHTIRSTAAACAARFRWPKRHGFSHAAGIRDVKGWG